MDFQGATVLRYQEVIDSVASRARPAFNEEGIDESVLDEVRALWEAKLVATGVVGEPNAAGHQLIQQQHASSHTGGLAVFPGVPGVQHHHLQQPPAAHAQFMAAHPGMPVGVARGGMPGGMTTMAVYAMLQAQAAAMAGQKRKVEAAEAGGSLLDAKQQRTVPQRDGPGDDGGTRAADEESAPNRRVAASGTRSSDGEADDDPLTEDDDDASGDDVDEASVNNVVLGQFEKVQRSKSKWKVVLKDCVLTLNGRDYLVRRCTGEMDF